MLLADLGAEVIQIDRLETTDLGVSSDPKRRISNRGRRSIRVNIKAQEGVAVVKRLVRKADILIEGFRPGVAERLGLGPDECFEINRRLVYGRVTGWGQDGPLAQSAAHDLNYIAISGALNTIGAKGGPPIPPLNYIGDFGGGAMYLALGVLAAVIEARKSGIGQVVDASVVDGVASLSTFIFTQLANGHWTDERGSNIADGGRPWYDVYRTKDGRYVSIAAIEERFYRELVKRAGIEETGPLPSRSDPNCWPEIRRRFAAVFATRTQAEWNDLLEGTDTCYAPVLSPLEASSHPHNQTRETFVERDGIVQPAPAPRFSRTPAQIGRAPVEPGADMREILFEHGFSPEEIAALSASSAIG
jgi:alpha-methylacyl-CoA racemase